MKSNRRRILFVSHVDLIGGAERSLLDLLATLDRSSFSPHVVVPRFGELSEAVLRMGLPVSYCPLLTRVDRRSSIRGWAAGFLAVVAGSLWMLFLALRIRPYIIHANSSLSALFCSLAGILPGISLVWHLRDFRCPRLVLRWLIGRSARIVAPTRSLGDLVQFGVGPRKLRIIPNGIEIARFNGSAPLSTVMLEDAEILLVSIAQLVSWKGLDLLIETAGRVAAAHPIARFVLVADDRFGSDGARGVLAERARDLIDRGRLRILGPGTDVPSLLKDAFALVHPSYPEPFGRVIVEAMAASRPVIAFDGTHGPAEILRHGRDGILVPERTSDALAEAVLRLIGDSELARRLGQSGRARAVEQFDRRTMTRRCEELYRVLDKRRSPGRHSPGD